MENKELILDYSKWRCGYRSDDIECRTGNGETRLLNEKGYMCCLGMFSLQLNSELTNADIADLSDPGEVNAHIPELNKESYMEDQTYRNTNLANEAIDINDDETTSVQKKVELLRELFGEKGHKIKVINGPEGISPE